MGSATHWVAMGIYAGNESVEGRRSRASREGDGVTPRNSRFPRRLFASAGPDSSGTSKAHWNGRVAHIALGMGVRQDV